MTISNIRPGRPSAISRHLSISKWRLSCLATGLLAVAMSSDIAHSRGMGLKSGYVCPYGYDFRCFNGACNCYEDADQTKAKRDFIKRQKALKRVTNPCGTEPCSPGNKSQPSSDRRRSPESGGSSSSPGWRRNGPLTVGRHPKRWRCGDTLNGRRKRIVGHTGLQLLDDGPARHIQNQSDVWSQSRPEMNRAVRVQNRT
jgi:hypothetical protein